MIPAPGTTSPAASRRADSGRIERGNEGPRPMTGNQAEEGDPETLRDSLLEAIQRGDRT